MRSVAGSRAVWLALLAFALSTSAHSAGGADVPPGPALVVMVFTLPLVIVVCRRRFSAMSTGLTLLALQAATHFVLTATSRQGAPNARQLGHHHIAVDPLPQHDHAVHSLSLRMMLSHLAATIVLTYCMSALDRHLAALVAAVLPSLPAQNRIVTPTGGGLGRPNTGFHAVRHIVADAIRARGPPLLTI